MDPKRLEDILALDTETIDLEFKSRVDFKNNGEILELLKDVVAIANSGGGDIIIGLNSDGTPCETELSGTQSPDPATITDIIHRYTGTHFSDFRFIVSEKLGRVVWILNVGASDIPLVFSKVGTYEVPGGKQKNAFSLGTVVFRHGAKSEPATSEDLRKSIERNVESLRRSWLTGIAKVVEAPAGAHISVVIPEKPSEGETSIRLVNDPSAQPFYQVPITETHPYRQLDVVREVNSILNLSPRICAHDILSVRRVHNTDKIPNYCFTISHASVRYSKAFVDWIIASYRANQNFFYDCRKQYEDKLKTTRQYTRKHKSRGK